MEPELMHICHILHNYHFHSRNFARPLKRTKFEKLHRLTTSFPHKHFLHDRQDLQGRNLLHKYTEPDSKVEEFPHHKLRHCNPKNGWLVQSSTCLMSHQQQWFQYLWLL
eukprot:Pompholyxophrys_punicea_v1_NODE_283_length_2392_cov_4.277706.p2 type:complete len:109 gc:universal NODE_283_length_2392_cov_4.277706:516-842(+)